MEQGRYDKAIEQFTEIMEKNPLYHQGAKWLLLSAYLHTGQWEQGGDFIDGFALKDHSGDRHVFSLSLRFAYRHPETA